LPIADFLFESTASFLLSLYPGNFIKPKIRSKSNNMERVLAPTTIKRIFHPSDFSSASDVAFAHALKFAVVCRGSLTILHNETKNGKDAWENFPSVREFLENWGILPQNSPRKAVTDLGLDIKKITLNRENVASSIVHYLDRHPHDFMVLATHQYDGFERFFHKTVALPIVRESGEIALFIPTNVTGFVSIDDGSVNLRNILIPIDKKPKPQLAINLAMTIAVLLDLKEAAFTLLHIGDEDYAPRFKMIKRDGWTFVKKNVNGNVENKILQTASETNADLIVMATQGQQGFLDVLRGSTTERIVRSARCPVLAVPSDDTCFGFQELPIWTPAL
jgi:nucleotide-binding universal stress UspA family protein